MTQQLAVFIYVQPMQWIKHAESIIENIKHNSNKPHYLFVSTGWHIHALEMDISVSVICQIWLKFC